MVEISWDAVLQTSFSIALVLVPVFAVYLLNERANRRAFEREKKYDRKREAYEKALSAVRRIWDAALMLRIFRTGVSDSQEAGEQIELLQNVEPDKRKEFVEAIDSVAKLVGGSLVISKFTDEELPPEFVGEGVDQSNMKDVLQRLTGRASAILLRVMNRAEDELTAALSTLTLADAPTGILGDLKHLEHPHSVENESGKAPTQWLDSQLKKIESAMKTDLQATIRNR